MFNNCKYSLPTKYIGGTVQLKHDDNNLYLCHNGSLVRTHVLSKKRFNYQREDMREIVESDLYHDRDDEIIDAFVDKNMQQFDELG
ncbi:Mu transposase domain-containing protein [Xylocopilactobacillus apicola]|uniref:Mu transposase domain-containing protein n=1 Tax=Xylocopilactobacillus apicola TaxID=2932184 RepID=UPI003CE51DD4